MSKKLSRSNFIKISGLSLAGTMTGFAPFRLGKAYDPIKEMTIQQIIELMINAAHGAPFENTVDTVKAGDSSAICTGVVTTFMDTTAIIQNAIDLGANLIVTHEPTYYNHLDETDWLEDDNVYEYKRTLLEENNIVVWRNHDYLHSYQPDGILQGLVEKIGWQDYRREPQEYSNIFEIPETTLRNLGTFFKKQLDLKRPFIVGNPDMKCSKIGLLPGASGGRNQIRMLGETDIEVLVVGEVSEWETSEYIRDAAFADMKKGLVILGHAPSEGPGMKYLANWLQPKIPDIPVFYEETPDAFIPV